eukprot:scaffold2717_cov73-Skeletonema_marinoi.AAC.1
MLSRVGGLVLEWQCSVGGILTGAAGRGRAAGWDFDLAEYASGIWYCRIAIKNMRRNQNREFASEEVLKLFLLPPCPCSASASHKAVG